MPTLHSVYAHRLNAREDSTQPQYALSPSLIVGICILAAVFFCVILATIIRLCSRDRGPENTENLYRPYDPGQIERMFEVRRINNKMAWDRGAFARNEIVKQGRRMSQGYDVGLDWKDIPLEQGAYEQNQYLSPHAHKHHGHRESHLPRNSAAMNPYAHSRPGRASKHMYTRADSKHACEDLDNSDDDDVDMEVFQHLPSLPAHVTRGQEKLRRSPERYNQHWQMRAREPTRYAHGYNHGQQAQPQDSQAYLGPIIATASPGLGGHNVTGANKGNGNEKVQMQSRLSRIPNEADFYGPAPEAFPNTPTTTSTRDTLMHNNHDFEEVSLNPTGPAPQKPEVNRVSYQEDYSAPIFSPTSTTTFSPQTALFSPVSPIDTSDRRNAPSPDRNDTVIRKPIITINDDVAAEEREHERQHRQYLGPLVNIGPEIGEGRFLDMPLFDEREARDIGGRYFAPGTAR